ncbi:hypothetical protein BGZ98_000719, partial [Dissophora globulifera]
SAALAGIPSIAYDSTHITDTPVATDLGSSDCTPFISSPSIPSSANLPNAFLSPSTASSHHRLQADPISTAAANQLPLSFRLQDSIISPEPASKCPSSSIAPYRRHGERPVSFSLSAAAAASTATAALAFHYSGFSESTTSSASQAQLSVASPLFSDQRRQSSLSFFATAPKQYQQQPLVPGSPVAETAVTIATTEIDCPAAIDPEKLYYLNRPRQRTQNAPPSIFIEPLPLRAENNTAAHIYHLFDDNSDSDNDGQYSSLSLSSFLPASSSSSSSPSGPTKQQTQVQRSLDYLEYLETSFFSEQEVKELQQRKRRPRGWYGIKNSVQTRLQRLSGSHSRNSSSSSINFNDADFVRKYIRPATPTFIATAHPNHSAPIIDRRLLSPSPSPSLPLNLSSSPIRLSRASTPESTHQRYCQC